MEIEIIFMFQIMLPLSVSIMRQKGDTSKSYCRPGLCTDIDGDGGYSSCQDSVLRNGRFKFPPCAKDAALIPLTDAEKQSILDFHNEQRNFVACGGLYKEYRLEPGCRLGVMTWDKDLEKTAFLHTSYCLFDHVEKCRGTVKNQFSGQNIAVLSYDKKPENVCYVGSINTKKDLINSFFNQTKWKVDQFLISINERNNRVGCMFARFFDEKTKLISVMLSCNYPAPNIKGSAVYNSCKKPASKCITGTDLKYKYLCSSKEPYNVSGLLQHIPYDGDGTEVFSCGKQTELYHFDRKGDENLKRLNNIYPDYLPIPVVKPKGDTTKKKRSVRTDDGDGDIFTDYCNPTLCEALSPGTEHTGCKGGVLHDGKFQHPPCPEDAAIIPLSDADKQLILDIHNEQRNFVACGGLYKEYRLPPGCRHGVVTWDKELEKTAFLHTSYCIFAHDKCRGTLKYPFSGQNLGELIIDKSLKSNTYYINAITYLWYVEYLDSDVEEVKQYPSDTKAMVGHLLSSINERNNRVGCTFAHFTSTEKKRPIVMLSCNYPTTNIIGTSIYNMCKNPASKCTTGTDPKYKYLCSSKEPYDVTGLLDLIPYDGTGNEVFECGRKQEFNHYDREGSEDIKTLHLLIHPNNPIPEDKPPAAGDSEKPKESKDPKESKEPEKAEESEKPRTSAAECYDGNPAAGGIPDYSEADYDPCDSSSAKLWHNGLPNLINSFILINFFF